MTRPMLAKRPRGGGNGRPVLDGGMPALATGGLVARPLFYAGASVTAHCR